MNWSCRLTLDTLWDDDDKEDDKEEEADHEAYELLEVSPAEVGLGGLLDVGVCCLQQQRRLLVNVK